MALKIGEKILNFYLNIRILRIIVFHDYRLKNILVTVWNLIIWERETIQMKFITIYVVVLIILDSFFKQSVWNCNSIVSFFCIASRLCKLLNMCYIKSLVFTIDSIIFLCRVSRYYVVISLKNKNYKNPDRRMASVKQKTSYVNITILILHN